MTAQENIETAVRRVRSGELSPAQATRVLLAAEQNEQRSDIAPLESLASLVSRLGAPPQDVVESWCQQLQSLADQDERQSTSPLPDLDLNRWAITWDGKLVRCDLDRQARQLDSSSAKTPTTITRLDSSGEPKKYAVRAHRSETANRRRMGPKARRTRLIPALIACLAIGGLVLYHASAPEIPVAANNDTPAEIDGASDAAVANSRRTRPAEAPGKLETLESFRDPESLPLEGASQLEPLLSLDDLMPPVASFDADENAFVPSQDEATESTTEDLERRSVTPADVTASDAVDDAIGQAASPSELPQPTRASMVRAVQLPAVDQVGQPTELSKSNLRGLQLGFPFEVPLTIGREDSQWLISDARKDQIVAAITSGPDGTEMKWVQDAIQSAVAAELVHGRITDHDGATIFLRPTVDADPWPIRFHKADLMPTWDLRFPIPPRVARISVEFGLPEDVKSDWVEPIESRSPRRTRGLAVLVPADSESVSLGVRLDVRCSRKLSCRVRYAARLDTSMPWQRVSNPLLDEFAQQLAQQAALISKEATRLAAVYELAGSEGRRILRFKRDRNDARAETIRTAAQRVAELQALIATLEAQGSIKLRVWVEWPDTQQELFRMRAVDDGAE